MSEPLSIWIPGGGDFVERAQHAAREQWVVHCDEAAPESAAHIRVLVSGVPKTEWLEALPALEAVVIPYAGVPPKTAALLERHPHVALHNLHHNAEPTAELALTLLLAVAKQVVPGDQQLRQGDWRMRYEAPTAWTLAGRKALVFGWGAIGLRVGRMLRAMDMQVIGVGRSARVADCGTSIVDVATLDDALGDAHVLMITAAATAQTRGLFDAARLEMLPRGALVVNVARGALLDETALFACLQSGQVGGAGLDVWWNYPRSESDRAHCAPGAHAFDTLDQVVFSPHRGGQTVETERLRGLALARLLDQAARGEPLDNRVDPRLGY